MPTAAYRLEINVIRHCDDHSLAAGDVHPAAIVQRLLLQHQFGDGDALATLSVAADLVGANEGMVGQEIAHRPAQRAGAFAVDDAYPRQPGSQCGIQMVIHPLYRFLNNTAPQIEAHAGGGRGADVDEPLLPPPQLSPVRRGRVWVGASLSLHHDDLFLYQAVQLMAEPQSQALDGTAQGAG